MWISWTGRAFVDEEQITPEQYKTFFDINEYGIKFNIANTILGNMYRDGCEEVVPCDELNAEAQEDITKAIHNGCTSGHIRRAGQKLFWQWKPELTADGEEIDFGALSSEAYDAIAKQMLDGCRCGEVYVSLDDDD